MQQVGGSDCLEVKASVGVHERAAIRKACRRVPVLQGIVPPADITPKSKRRSQVTTKRLIGLQPSGNKGVNQKPEKRVREAIFTRVESGLRSPFRGSRREGQCYHPLNEMGRQDRREKRQRPGRGSQSQNRCNQALTQAGNCGPTAWLWGQSLWLSCPLPSTKSPGHDWVGWLPQAASLGSRPSFRRGLVLVTNAAGACMTIAPLRRLQG
ncbi:hypothetical protein H6F86_25805 [Phormidium sp. FACHB-592]|uniref:Uncharacterized protein n=1 Tax=Stenomitos frigidus AS-A4 TaxID=2933935 RepID=A0ABV0KTI2_9CYAN|nr:hypothetical protein [Phormidium sp. FACHB-592]MBD2077231.1 hypothetical protein [Phormidium sp. FACHB-592]